jgi:hypothetical protein
VKPSSSASACQTPAPPGRRAWAAAAALSLVALLLVYRPYAGVAQDGRIYVGFALAALDPQGVGRDLMFAMDGQADLSLFPRAFTVLARWLGPSAASRWATLAGLLAWLAAAAAFLGAFARGRMLWAALACVVILDPAYGGFDVFGYLGPYLTPRTLAEALVLAGLAALIGRRRIVGVTVLGLAGLVHPVMALPGVAVGFVLLAAEDRRWLAAGAAAVLAAAIAAVLRLPMAERLLTVIDPLWLQLLHSRATYLFPGLWRASDYGRLAVQLVTVAVAAGLAEGRARLALVTIMAVAVGGVGLALVFGEVSLLIAQLQPWRATWLLAVAANAGLALAAMGLWRRGGPDRVVLAVLAMAWLVRGEGWTAVGFAAAVAAVHALSRTGRLSPPSPPMRAAIGLALFGLLAAWLARAAPVLNYLRLGLQQGAPFGWADLLRSGVPRLAAPAAIALCLVPWPRAPRRTGWAAAAVAGAAAAAALLTWDSRSPEQRMIDEAEGAGALQALIGSAPGPVQWIDGGIGAWRLAGRANWAVSLQGAAGVFSRPLAMTWSARQRSLIALGLAQPGDLDPYRRPKLAPTRPSRSGVLALCSRADAPVAVIMAAPAPAGLPARLWRAPAAQYVVHAGPGGRAAWRRIDAYAVVSCPAARRALSGLRP